MRMRILAAASPALLAVALAPASAMAAPDDPVPLKGTLWTTMAEAEGPPDGCMIEGNQGIVLTIVENGLFNSTLTQLGLVTLEQRQCVYAAEEQDAWADPVTGRAPAAAGLIQVLEGTFTAANGDTLTFTTPAVEFATFVPDGLDPSAGPLPIGFEGTLDITGGTGRFASADGSAQFGGMYCFRANGGRYTLKGHLDR